MTLKYLACALLTAAALSLLIMGNPILVELGKGLLLISVISFTAVKQQSMIKELPYHNELSSGNQNNPEAIQMTNRKVA